jgi:hypothetical protein
LEDTLTLAISDNIEDTDWVGNSPSQSRLVLTGSNNTATDAFHNLTLQGSLLGSITASDVIFDSVTDFNGAATDCTILNTLTLAGSSDVSFVNCVSGVAGSGKPTVDVGSGRDVYFRNWTGGLEIINKTGADSLTIDLISGSIEIASSCDAGTIVIRGIGDLIDNSADGCTVTSDGLVNNLELRKLQFADTVYIDAASGTAGTSFPIGTSTTPVNNEADALSIAVNFGIQAFHIRGPLSLTTTYTKWSFSGFGSSATVIDTNGQSIGNCAFMNCEVVGAMVSTGENWYERCHITDHTGISGDFMQCHFSGTLGLTSGGEPEAHLYACWNAEAGATFTVDMNGADGEVVMNEWFGHVTFANITNADSIVRVHGIGLFTLPASNTSGSIHLMGIGGIEDQGHALTILTPKLVQTDADGLVRVRDDDVRVQRGLVSASPDLPSTTIIPTNLTESANGHWKDAFCRFLSGSLIGQVKLVTGYTGSSKQLTTEAFTNAPAAGDQFVLINV